MSRIVIFVFLIITSCNERSRTKKLSHEKNASGDLESELYTSLLNYQKKYPIPDNKNELELFVYEGFFYKLNDDTLFLLRRSSEGVQALKNEILMGVYKDDSLSPTVIRDSKDFYSKNFLKRIIKDSASLENVKPLAGHDYPESYPPTYNFKVSGKKLFLNKIDTVWQKW